MKSLVFSAAGLAMLAAPVAAQDRADATMQQQSAPLPLVIGRAVEGNAVLPAGTEVMLRMNENVTTGGTTWAEGDTFDLTVAHDIMMGQYVVIPAGSMGLGRITSLSSRGAFGRSGKMDVEIEHITVQGRQIDVNGTFRQEGDGATLETLGGVLVAGIFAGFVTGESAVIPNGRELRVTLADPLELSVSAASIEPETRQISEADSDWRTYMPFVDSSLSPSQRVMQARRMRDAAIADARAQSEGQVEIVGKVISA